jgi:hypothetical protein
MTLDWGAFIGISGPLSLCILFVILGFISRRLGRVTRTGPYFFGFFIAAALVGVSVIARLYDLVFLANTEFVPGQAGGRIALYTGLPALGISIAAFVIWRYWSWLLAERD